jgi:hypothetical protein
MYLNGAKYATLTLSCFLSLSLLAKNAVPTVGQGAQKPLSFIENKGQMTDGKGNPENEIAYVLSTPGMNLYIGNGQLHYQFRKTEGGDDATAHIKTYGMDVTLVGANKNAKVTATEQQAYYENYYTNNAANPNGITAHSYNRVTYKEVYPGIDWVLYVKGTEVEYDFVVHPGADASQIKLQYGGATALSINPDGGITAETPMGKIQEKSPYAYDKNTGKQVAAKFMLQNNVVSFATGKCNGTLTIDPLILWSTYFGGANEDVATCVKVSGGGNIYVGGYSSSTTVGFTGVGVGIDNSFGGAFDAFLTKYDAAGVRQFTTYFGAAGNDRGTCLAIDGTGAGIYLGGFTTGSAGLASPGAYRGTNSGLVDGYVFKINNNGTRQWATYYGGPGNDYVNGITCDAANNVYITGRTESASLIATAGVFQGTRSGAADAFVAKFNGPSATGTIIFSSYYGGTGVDEGAGIACDGSNNVIITGQTNSIVNIATAGAHQTTLGGVNDAFVGKLNTTGTTRLWGTYFGGSGTEQGTEAVCNTITGAVGIIGYTTSTSGIASANAHQTTYGGGVQDAFVSYFTSTGAVSWSTYYGGSDLDYGETICLDPQRNIVIGGGTFSTNGIASTISFQPTIGGNYDAFAAKLTPLGQRMWGTYFGNTLYDYAFGVACDNAGQIILAGHTTSTAGISSIGASQPAYAGGTYDAFVTKFRPDTFVVINQPYTDTLVCAGGQLRLNYTVNANFMPGNIFTAQLSDASGSFVTPVNIGTAAAVASGNIICTIPIGTTLGTGYRVRITSSTPAFISPDNFANIRVISALPAVTLSANTPVCVGNTLSLFATATWSISSYNWTGPASFSSALQNPTRPSVTLLHGGTYTVTTVHNGCPNNVNTVDVVVNDVIPASPVAFASALNCDGGTLFLYADTGSTIPATYSWTGPGGFTSTDQNPVVTPVSGASAGSYLVRDTVDGCASLPTTVTVSITPTVPVSVNIVVSPNDTVCGSDTVSFTAFAVNGGISPAFQWMNGAFPVVGAISNSWSSTSLTDGAMISCMLTSNAQCPSPATATSNVIKMNVITNEPIVNIFALPGTSVPPGDSVTFYSTVYNVGVGATYQWQRNGADISGATNTTYKLYNVTRFDTISLIVTSTMACATTNFAKSNSLVAHPNTSVAEVSTQLYNIELFPNPNPGNFTITGDINVSGANDVSIAVLNPLGQVVYTDYAILQNGKLNKNLRVDNLASGIYLLQVSADGSSKTLRFSVQR